MITELLFWGMKAVLDTVVTVTQNSECTNAIEFYT